MAWYFSARQPVLQVLTNRNNPEHLPHPVLAERLFAAGAEMVQIREKDQDFLVEQLKKHPPKQVVRRPHQHLILNDFPEIAARYGFDGVHLGVQDVSPEEARELLGPSAIIGFTVHNEAELQRGNRSAADYFGIGPVFGTHSKQTGLPPLGVAGLRALCAEAARPVLGIGNLQPENCARILEAGAAGIAVLSGILQAADQAAAVRAYRSALSGATG